MKNSRGRFSPTFAVLVALLLAAGARGADEPQVNRFLLVFETSPAMKKNLPQLKQTLASLFASNLQGQIASGDDLAVWAVDQELHTGTFPLETWDPNGADIYAERLVDFLDHQKYTRRSTLGALQPLLSRVVRGSDKLTVLIFCDSQSRLQGTPYDDGVNEIITNTAAKLKNDSLPFVLVLRGFHGQYLGCSVNRSAPLNFPHFPAPPKPETPPVKAVTVTAPHTTTPAPQPAINHGNGPVVTPVPALIIVGTNATTNIAALKPSPPPVTPTATATVATTPPPEMVTAPAPPPVATPPVITNPPAAMAPSTNIAAIAPKPPVIPPPAQPAVMASNPPPSTPPPSIPTHTVTAISNTAPHAASPTVSSVQPTSAPPAHVAEPANPPTVTATIPDSSASNGVAAAADGSTPDSRNLLPWVAGSIVGVAALAGAVWMVSSSRRPRGSLITSSMQDDSRMPPRS